MDDKQLSPKLTTLLSKLNKGHNWTEEQVLSLRAPERLIFKEAVKEKRNNSREEFAKMIKSKD